MAVIDVDQIDAIGVEGKNLKLLIIDYLDWEYEDMHLDVLQEKINNYLVYIEDKQYFKDYGDNFEKKIIDIKFQHSISENGMKFLNVVSSQLNDTDIFINIHLPGE
ncbi:DUF6572 domain-containing protein [Bacillus albus]|uniref:Uncharacterized protein n=3 Tax=Bacillus cereus group TaxID=86661 RepID=A0A9W3ZV82_BACTO|nr:MULTISPECIES: DUF6572 domain-containing protein [Bacillus]MRB01764.1 hypothetical protein [Bacillus thuringiensis]OUB12049.1 hypothetical protein BK708_28485 [Bacillus thuringiensis serovar yunnanensis]ATI60469.1 hypothetical protein CPZ31_16380 [Bacillus cereus]EJR37571.1 hypothetical protein IIE_01735 [Bacillus cereus VD045]KMN67805.1 hypothetical protein VK96_24015 [Bacillus cereus]